ncbi:MAG: tRNA (adenosine(37)-N6)-dimethylallyltransferase MiaA [Candidatus Stygibacter frigidus]|nr:tRNA (adenosine(37)-N6)-dimethylallyltransferase MiaA [Candidatus Stygibacter frigidus]
MAEEFGAEIISADSRQVYRYLDIGTAKPDKATQEKIGYHLIDIVNPDEIYNAGLFCQDAWEAVDSIINKKKIPFMAGGTGFYISAFLKGLAAIPEITDTARDKVREMLLFKSNDEIFSYLMEVDPEAGKKIEMNDQHRIQRALEVFETTGKPISWFWSHPIKKNDLEVLNVLLMRDRAELYKRINKRIDYMLTNGLIEEIRSLLQNGYHEGDPGMVSVGYREFYPWLRGEINYSEAVEFAKQHSRNYAKRQLTWYRKQDFDLTISMEDINIYNIKEEIARFLGKGE